MYKPVIKSKIVCCSAKHKTCAQSDTYSYLLISLIKSVVKLASSFLLFSIYQMATFDNTFQLFPSAEYDTRVILTNVYIFLE